MFAFVIIFLEQIPRNGSTKSNAMNITKALSLPYFRTPFERVHQFLLSPSDDKSSSLKSFSPDSNTIILKDIFLFSR